MAYSSNTLIARAGYSGIGDWWDTITGGVGKVLQVYSTEQQAQGASAQAQRDIMAAMQAQQSSPMTTILLVGGVGLVAYMLLRKKKE